MPLILTEAETSPSCGAESTFLKLSVFPMHHTHIAKHVEAVWHTVKVKILNLVAEHRDTQAPLKYA